MFALAELPSGVGESVIRGHGFQELVAVVAASYLGRSPVESSEIPAVITRIAETLRSIVPQSAPVELEVVSEPEPPAQDADEDGVQKASRSQIRKSITPDALISFEDGKGYRTLRLHLASRGFTPESYREKWGLPADYPMVAPNYSAQRSQMAKDAGLGRRPKSAAGSKASGTTRDRRAKAAGV